MLTSSNPAWKASVKLMRFACPAGVGAAILIAAFAYWQGAYLMMAIDAFCGGVCAVLTWMQWRLFKL